MRIRLRHDSLARHLAESRRSQNAWALRLKLSRGHLSDLLNGKHPYPSAPTRRKLLEGVNLSFEDLFEIEDGSKTASESSDSTPASRPHSGEGAPGSPRKLRQRQTAASWTPLLFQTALAALLVMICTGAWLVFDRVYLAPLPFQDSHDLIAIRQKSGDRMGPSPSWPNFIDVRQRARLLASSAAYVSAARIPLRDEAGTFAVRAAVVTEEFFRTLAVSPDLGRIAASESASNAAPQGPMPVVIGHRLWRERYGSSTAVLGSTIETHGLKGVVSAVLPQGFDFPDGSQVWAPHSYIPAGDGGRNAHNLGGVIARLKEDVSLADSALELNAIAQRLRTLHPQLGDDFGLAAIPLKAYLYAPFRGPALLLGLAALLLWIPALQAALALQADAETSGPDASRPPAAGQSARARRLFSPGWVSIAAAALGVPAGLWLGQLLQSGLGISAASWPASLVSLTGLAMAAAAVALSLGLGPALLKAPRLDPARQPEALRDRYLRRSASAASLILLGAAVYFGYQWQALAAADPGFEPAGLIEVRLNVPAGADAGREAVFSFHQRLLRRIEDLEQIEGATLAFSPPLSDALKIDSAMQSVTDGGPQDLGFFDFRVIEEGYFSVLGLTLSAGRGFQLQDRGGNELVAVVNDGFANRVWGGAREALGKQVLVPGQAFDAARNPLPLRIVGVAPDLRQRSLGKTPRPALYVPYRQYPVRAPYMRLVARARQDPEQAAALIWQVIYEVSPGLPSSQPRLLEDLVEALIGPARFLAIASALAAALALALAWGSLRSTTRPGAKLAPGAA